MSARTTVLALTVFALLGCGAPSREQPPQEITVAAATTAVAATQIASRFEAGGVVRARVTAPIASRILAPVTAVHVKAGDRVRRGAPLVTLDDRETKANQARASAAFAGAQQAITAAEGAVRAAEASAALARTTHQRIRTLHDTRSATDQELDQAASALDAAEAQVSTARANLSAANAARDAAQAALDAATIAASYTVISAPFDGVVTERLVDAGAMASPGMPLLTLEDPAAYQLEVTLDEARAADVAPGQTAEVEIEHAASSGRLAGRVAEIARVEPRSHGFTVKIDLPAGAVTRSGGFGRAWFSGASRTALLVPATAVVRRGQLTFVFTVDAGNRAHLQPVSLAPETDGRFEVLAGLADGDRIVVRPPPAIVEGARITGGAP